MRRRGLLLWIGLLCAAAAHPSELNAERLGVIYDLDDPASSEIAHEYSVRRSIPAANLIGVHIPNSDRITPAQFAPIRQALLNRLPTNVQSLALVWSKPYAVGWMSITSAFAAGYRSGFCEPGCSRTLPNPMFDVDGWLPADTAGWWPAMMIPTNDLALARALIHRGVVADATSPTGTAYLVRTQDANRNVRSAEYVEVEQVLGGRLRVVQLSTPVSAPVVGVIAYFTGTAVADELEQIHFLPGAAADHLTSTGGVLFGGSQMSALSWIKQGATASYGTVSEPCNYLEKFPNIGIFLEHYLRGETVLEAYWKSVAMPGQGLFIGEPLARPFAAHRQ